MKKDSMNSEMRRAEGAPALPRGPVGFIFHCIRGFGWGLFFMVLFETGQAACHILLPKAIQTILDQTVNLQNQASDSTWTQISQQMQNPILFFVLLNVGVLLFSRASGALLVLVGPSIRRRTRAELYHYLQHHSQRYFLGNFAGSLANRISEVSVSVNHTLWVVLFDFWPIAVTFVVSIIVLSQVHLGLTLFLSAWTLVFVLASFLLGRKCRKYAKNYAAKRSLVTGKIVDAVTNIQNSKLFAHLGYERRYLRNYLNQEVQTARQTFWFMEKIRWFNFTSALILQVSMLLYALKVWTQGEITVGQFAMASSLALLIIGEARNLSRRFLEYFEYVGNINDGVHVIVQSHEVVDPPQSRPIQVKRGLIEFQAVDFYYHSSIPVFQNLNVKISPGERVGLVGFSGSGKTTFVNLLLRLFDIQSGHIKIDDQDIASATQNSLRSQISMIPQDPMLFHRSLMDNIRYGNIEATDAQVMEASRSAHAHDFITQVKGGYDALVGERGIKLSGGQRQRIAIARAILKNSPILIMDEATSSLDSVTEKAIQAGLEKLMQGRTVIVVAHRLSTIAHLDRILVFDQGKIIEDGTHEDLLRQQGHYARLWDMQAGGFLPTAGEERLETTDPMLGYPST